MSENCHAGHRKRVRDEFLEKGFSDATPAHKVIEMLLFYCIPRQDTNEIAHVLLDRFKTVSAILEASPEELMKVKGIGQNAAALIKLLLPIFRLYQNDKADNSKVPFTMDGICDFLIKKHFGFSNEVFAVTTFNSKGAMIAFDILNHGDVSSVGISTRSVIETVIKRKAVCAVISHNHPNGNALPSPEDIAMTHRINSALKHINVKLLDHVIIADNDCVSLAQSQAYYKIFRDGV